FTLFGRVNEGRPFSAVYTNGGDLFGDTLDFRHLIYVPTGPNDPNVVFGPNFDTAAIFDYLAKSGLDEYAGRIAPRNAMTSAWWHKYDIRIEQELPGFNPDHRLAAFLLIENVGNLLNDDWGVLKEESFPRAQAVVQIAEALQDGAYVYEEFFAPAPHVPVTDASLWEIRFGISYDF